MNAIEYILTFPWVQPLGWTLVHFLWQGLLVGLFGSILLRLTRSLASNTRYLLSCGLLFLCVLAPVITFVELVKPTWIFGTEHSALGNGPVQAIDTSRYGGNPITTLPNEEPGNQSDSVIRQHANPGFQPAAPIKTLFSQFVLLLQTIANDSTRWIVPIWLVGVVGMGIRLGTGWLRIQHWRLTSVPLVDPQILDLFAQLTKQMGLRKKVCLFVSEKVISPITLGWLKPVILIPGQVLTGLSAQELEAILAHELVHVARHDYLVNLFQSAIEVMLFYHPAVWWLSRQIREIREECCDHMALRLGANRQVYVKALAGLAEMQLTLEPALAAGGGALLSRISRLLGHPDHKPTGNRSYAAWIFTLAGAVFVSLVIFHSRHLFIDPDIIRGHAKAPPFGQVLDPNGAPVVGARVLLYYETLYWSVDNQVVEKATTDSQGHYHFTKPLTFKIAKGTDLHDHYIVIATNQVSAPAWKQVYVDTPEQKGFILQLTNPVSHHFKVIDHDGQPVEGADVWLTRARSQTNREPIFEEELFLPEDIGICHGITDASGQVTLNNLPDTMRGLIASKSGFEERLGVNLEPGIHQFTLEPGASLGGRVTDPLGLPVEGATVWLYPKFAGNRNNLSRYFMSKTDKNGMYHIDRIWAQSRDGVDWGKYQVGLRDPRLTVEGREIAFTPGQTITGFDLSAIPIE